MKSYKGINGVHYLAIQPPFQFNKAFDQVMVISMWVRNTFIGKWRTIYSIGAMLNSITWGLYFSFTRRYLTVDLKGGIEAMLLITGLEWGLTLFASLSDKLSRILGDRNVILLGVSGFVFMFSPIFIDKPYVLAFPLSMASFTWAISWPIILSAVFVDTVDAFGKTYSYFTFGTGIGFSVGSILMGFLFNSIGPKGISVIMGLMYLTTYILFTLFFPSHRVANNEARDSDGPRYRDLLKISFPFMISISLSVFARELLFATAPYKLNMEIERVLGTDHSGLEYVVFGIVYGGVTSILSIPVRILSGILVDKYSPLSVYIISVLLYTGLYWSFMKTSGLISLLLWQIPLFPLQDTSINTYIAKQFPGKNRALGFGISIVFSAMGGLMLLPLLANPRQDVEFLGYLITTVSAFSIILAYLSRKSLNKQ